MYEYRSIENSSKDEMVECLNEAFSDYFVPIHFTKETLKEYFAINDINPTLSYAAFHEHKMVGFILDAYSEDYNGSRAVFDAGTGVIPQYRGKGVFTALFQFAERKLKESKVDKYYLEVMKQNSKAISLYQQQGFSVVREFSVFHAQKKQQEKENPGHIEYKELKGFDVEEVKHCNCFLPSFENSFSILNRRPDLYQWALVRQEGEVSAFCIFAKKDGRIAQMGYRNPENLKNIFQALLLRYDQVLIKNIDIRYDQISKLLLESGFSEICRQYEMEKELF